MYENRLYAQDAVVGHIGCMLDAITTLAETHFESFSAAVAYATAGGSELLVTRLHEVAKHWQGSRKRFLIGIDFGRTEPNALVQLATLPNAEVRIPNGLSVLRTVTLMPRVIFHPKVYVVRTPSQGRPTSLGVFVGSANLTVSGLTLGSECGVLQRWVPPLGALERQMLRRHWAGLAWFERVWSSADPVHAILPMYQDVWRRAQPAPSPVDPCEELLYRGKAGNVVQGAQAVRLATARALWVETETLYKNRGPTHPGNQLDLPRGTRVFFGFPPDDVPRNTIFGELVVECVGFAPVVRTMRFGNNMMDKLNLPVPGAAGPPSYDHSVLLLERVGVDTTGRPHFRVQVGRNKDLARWKKRATAIHEEHMQGGRGYGLFF